MSDEDTKRKEDKRKEEEEKLKKLGATIKKYADELYPTQEAFTVAAEITREYGRKIFKGEANPSYLVLTKVAHALHKTLDELENPPEKDKK